MDPRIQIATRRRTLKDLRTYLNKLTTREAQVIRMINGVDESDDDQVGPPDQINQELLEKLLEIEAQVIGRYKNHTKKERKKKKIVKKLKD
jgi:DNA-directed RNA polymerase sigma subunit (sigma70/sigma32)